MNRFVLTLIFSLLYFSTYSQNKEQEVEFLLESYTATVGSKPDSALYYINQATIKCGKISNDFLMSRCVFNLGYHYYLQNQPKKAEKLFNQSLLLAKKSKNNKVISASYNQLGLLLTDEGNYNESLKKYLLALEIADKNNLDKNKCATLINIGSLYEYQKDSIKALNYYLEAEKIALRNDLKSILLSTYGSIAIIKRKSDKESSLHYYKKANQIAKELKDTYEEFNTLINLSNCYLYFNTEIKNRAAYLTLKKAEVLAIRMNSSEKLFYVYLNLGVYCFNKNEFTNALDYYNKAKPFYNQVSIDQKLYLNKSLIEVYKKTNVYEKAYLIQEKCYLLKDSIFSIEKNKSFTEIQTKYEVEKKNLKINLLSKEKQIERNKRLVTIYLSIALIVPLLLVLLFYINRIKTQKLIRQKENTIFEQEKKQLQKEQELKRILGVLQGQDQERNRLAKEIHDGVGGKLAGIKLHLSQINSMINNQKIHEIITSISNVFQELRAISHNLSQNHIGQQKLTVLLQEVIREYEERNEFQIELVVFPAEGLDQLSQETKHNIYRIMQELLANISKHAQAKNVLINITKHDDFLNIILEDDGKGFVNTEEKGIGIKNIEERLTTINGKIQIESTPNKGSTILIDIPTTT